MSDRSKWRPATTKDKVALVIGGGGMGTDAGRKRSEDGGEEDPLLVGNGEALAQWLGCIGAAGTNRASDDIAPLPDGALQRWGGLRAR